MFNIQNLHYLSLIIALFISVLFHISFVGIGRNLLNSVLIIVLLPFFLMGASLFLPQLTLSILSYSFFFIGVFLFFKNFHSLLKKPFNKIKNYSKEEKWFFGFTIVYLLSFFMSSTFIDSGGLIQDSLVYHLQGPKEWALFLDGAKFNTNNPITYTTSYYEYIYYYIFLILKPIFVYTAPIADTCYEFAIYTILLIAQIFSAIIAYIYVPIIITKISANLKLYRFLPIFFVFGIRMLTWTWPLSKNDIYPFFCFLTSTYIVYKFYISNKFNSKIFPLLLSFCILGIGTTAKLTNAHVILISLLFLLIFYSGLLFEVINKYGLVKVVTLSSFSVLVGCSFFLIRNFVETGNPFYPTAKFGFPNVYLTDYADRPELYSDPAGLKNAISKFVDFFKSHISLTVILVFGMFLKVRKESVLIFFCFGLMSSLTGIMYNYRMTNSLLILIFIYFLLFFKEYQIFDFKYKNVALSVFVIAFSYLQFEKLIKIPSKYYFEAVSSAIERSVENWPLVLNNNLANYDKKNYVFHPKEEAFAFFSRFTFISEFDSVEKFRYDYYKKSDQPKR